MQNNLTRVFFVVDNDTENREIFATAEEALKWAEDLVFPSIYISIVRNAFIEKETGSWNYADYSDTFEDIKTFTREELSAYTIEK